MRTQHRPWSTASGHPGPAEGSPRVTKHQSQEDVILDERLLGTDPFELAGICSDDALGFQQMRLLWQKWGWSRSGV